MKWLESEYRDKPDDLPRALSRCVRIDDMLTRILQTRSWATSDIPKEDLPEEIRLLPTFSLPCRREKLAGSRYLLIAPAGVI